MNDKIYGVYTLVDIESYKNNVKTSEAPKDGVFVFTQDNNLSVVNSSNEWLMAYTGSFRIENDDLIIKVKACSSRELEGKEIHRKILKLDGINLVLESPHDGGYTHITWKKSFLVSSLK